MKPIITVIIISILIIALMITAYAFRENFKSLGIKPFDWKCNPSYSGGEYFASGKTTCSYVCDVGCTDERCNECVKV